jgi:hypothetical protein
MITHVPAQNNHRFRCAHAPDQIQRLAQLPGARLRNGVVQGHDQIGPGRVFQPLQNDRPGLQVVGQGQGTEIMPQGRADPSRRRLGRRNPGQDHQVHGVPTGLLGLVQGFQNRRRHGEDPRIAG